MNILVRREQQNDVLNIVLEQPCTFDKLARRVRELVCSFPPLAP